MHVPSLQVAAGFVFVYPTHPTNPTKNSSLRMTG